MSKNLPKCINIKNNNFNFKKKAIVLGSESHGMSKKGYPQNCDVLTRINMRENNVDSINVVQAATIALYELCN